MKPAPEREHWADLLRAIAIVAVIVLHVSAVVVYRFESIPAANWWLANILNSISRFCVPVFLMLTGTFVLPNSNSYPRMLRRLGMRILLPFLFWAVIHLAVQLYLDGNTSLEAAEEAIARGISYHFWYIYLVTAIYLILPLLNRLVTWLSRRVIIAILLIWPLSFLLTIEPLKSTIPFAGALYLAAHIGYVLLGYLLAGTKPQENTTKTGMIVYASGVMATGWITYALTASEGDFVASVYQYLSPTVVLASGGLYLAMRKWNKPNRIALFLSNYSYGIYLSHVMILNALLVAGINIHSMWFIPVASAISLATSALMVYVVSRLPLGKYVSGRLS